MNANNNANNANTKITFAQISPEALAVLGGARSDRAVEVDLDRLPGLEDRLAGDRR